MTFSFSKKHNSVKNRSGFTILYAVLISSILLAIGTSVYNTSVREIALSSIASNSQIASYAQDAGLECAEYWTAKYVGTVTSAFDVAEFTGPERAIKCNDTIITGTTEEGPGGIPTSGWSRIGGGGEASAGGNPTSQFYFLVPAMGGPASSYEAPCVAVYITPDVVDTVIDAYGYSNCLIGDPSRVEQGYRAHFN